MFAMTGRPITLLFIAMTPIMMVGGYITNRRRDKRKLAKQIARFDEGLRRARRAARGREARSSIGRASPRSRRRPSSCGAAAQLGPLLWTRRPEHWSFLSLRLGSAAMPSRNTVDDDQRGDLMFEFQERLDEVDRGRTASSTTSRSSSSSASPARSASPATDGCRRRASSRRSWCS